MPDWFGMCSVVSNVVWNVDFTNFQLVDCNQRRLVVYCTVSSVYLDVFTVTCLVPGW
jgi:hypothetical protein